MKDMTEKEARAALKKAMPWAKYIIFEHNDDYYVEVRKGPFAREGVVVWAATSTLRTAVRRCIAVAKKVGAAK